MNTQRSLLSLVYSFVGIVFLCACNFPSEPRSAVNDHLHFTYVDVLSIDRNGSYILNVRVINGAEVISPSAELVVELEYKTITNGGMLRCNSDIDPTSQPCKPPIRCSETLIYQIPSSKASSWWQSPTTMIGPAVGKCACLRGQCEGSVKLSLRSPHDPKLERSLNVTNLISWDITGNIFPHSGYTTRVPGEENWP